MTDDRAIFEATYSDWKPIKTRRVIQIVFEVPWERENEAYRALGGMPDPGSERWFGIARLDLEAIRNQQKEAANTEIAESSPQPLQTPPGGAPINRTQRAVRMSKDPLFQKYVVLQRSGPCDPADYIRSFCEVKSRKDILPDTSAAEHFDYLYDQYRLWRDAPELQES